MMSEEEHEIVLKCLSCGVQAPYSDFKHLPKCKATIQKGTDFMTEEQARNYQHFGMISSKPWKRGGWRAITRFVKCDYCIVGKIDRSSGKCDNCRWLFKPEEMKQKLNNELQKHLEESKDE